MYGKHREREKFMLSPRNFCVWRGRGIVVAPTSPRVLLVFAVAFEQITFLIVAFYRVLASVHLKREVIQIGWKSGAV